MIKSIGERIALRLTKSLRRTVSLYRCFSSGTPSTSSPYYKAMLLKQQRAVDITSIVESTIIYEDSSIVVVNKPPSVLSQPVEDGSPNMLQSLMLTRPTLYQIRRLDRNCSGIMVFAKTEKSASFLSRYLRNDGIDEAENERQNRGVIFVGNLTERARAKHSHLEPPSKLDFSREYICVVNGEVRSQQERLIDFIKIKSSKSLDGNSGFKALLANRSSAAPAPGGSLKAELAFKRICSFEKPDRRKGSVDDEIGNVESISRTSKSKNSNSTDSASISGGSDAPKREMQSVLAVYPLAGPKHHIRAQLAGIGHPIVGDSLYGAPQSLKHKEIAMHSRSVSFLHPDTHRRVTFVAEEPLSWTLRFGSEALTAIKKFKW